jgi:hypothetical protein
MHLNRRSPSGVPNVARIVGRHLMRRGSTVNIVTRIAVGIGKAHAIIKDMNASPTVFRAADGGLPRSPGCHGSSAKPRRNMVNAPPTGLACGDAEAAFGQDALVMSRSGHDDDTPVHPAYAQKGRESFTRPAFIFCRVPSATGTHYAVCFRRRRWAGWY